MLKTMLQRAGKWAALLLFLIVCYTAALLLVYLIPDQWVEQNVNSAIAILEEERQPDGGGYANYFWHSAFGITDNLTDKVMFGGMLKDGRTTAQAAMRTDYLRYWHGYAVTLRPLCAMLSIINIRFLNMMVLYALFALCYYHCRRRLGAWAAFFFGAGLMMSFILIAPFCQQYMTVYLLTLLACYLLLRFWERLRCYLPEFFLMLGSLVCFFDFLTFPVLALGYPLLLTLLMECRENRPARTLWLHTVGLSALWMIAYALTWLCKAPVGTLLTGENVLADIMEQVAFRTTGDWEYVHVTPLDSIRINLKTFFFSMNALCFAVLLAAALVRALRRFGGWKNALYHLPVAVVALWPFAWYCVLQNHVRLHFWMTHKQLAVTVFALGAYLCAAARNGLCEKMPAESDEKILQNP